MTGLKPKERHEQLLARADREKIVEFLSTGGEEDIARIAVTLARQCDLLVHFRRLWTMRVSDLDQSLSSEHYIREIFLNRTALYKELFKPATR